MCKWENNKMYWLLTIWGFRSHKYHKNLQNYFFSKVFDANDNSKLNVFGDEVGLRVDSLRRQTYPSTYLDIDEECNGRRSDFRGSKTSLGLISTHSSQHLSMGDVEAKSYKMLSSNDELDDTSINVRYKNIFTTS